MTPVSQLGKLRQCMSMIWQAESLWQNPVWPMKQLETRTYRFTAGTQFCMKWMNINVGDSLVTSHGCECSSYSVQTVTNGNADSKESCEKATFNFFLQLQTTCVTLGKIQRIFWMHFTSQKVTTLKWCIKSKWECKPEWFIQRTPVTSKCRTWAFTYLVPK